MYVFLSYKRTILSYVHKRGTGFITTYIQVTNITEREKIPQHLLEIKNMEWQLILLIYPLSI